MNKIKTILKVLLGLIVVVLLVSIAIPYFFKDQLIAEIETAANEQLDASLQFEDVSISLLRHFPNLMVDISGLSITGNEEFDGLALYTAAHTLLDFDLSTLWSEDPVKTIKRISLVNPTINIATTAKGKTNYEIMKSSASTDSSTETAPLLLDLSDFDIENGRFVYNDQSTIVVTKLEDINLKGSASLRGDTYAIKYNGSIDETNVKASGVKYLRDAKTAVRGTLVLDLQSSKYSFEKNELKINDLDLDVDGWLQMQRSAILMDINFKNHGDSFKELWSLVPAAYTADYKNANINGQMSVSGYVRGTYDDSKTQLPSFDLTLKADNGSVAYPGMPKDINDLFADVNINSTGSLDQLSITIPQFKFNLEDSPFEGRFAVKNASSNPDIDMALDGSIDLNDLKDVIPMEGISILNGLITTDIQVKGRMSDLNNGDYQNTLISGNASIVGFELAQADQPKISLSKAEASFSPQSVKISNVQGRLGDTRFNADMSIDNVVALLVPGQEVKGMLNWKSDVLDLNQWMTSEDNNPGTNPTTSSADNVSYLPENFQMIINAESDLIKYGIYDAKSVKIKGQMNNGELEISNMSTTVDQSDIAISGSLSNVLGFVFGDEIMAGDMKMTSTYLNLNQFMAEDDNKLAKPTSEEEELEPIVIPNNIQVDVDMDIRKMTYDNIDISNIDGIVRVANGEARMDNVVAKAFDGEFNLNGGYIGRDGETPKFDLEYTINKFNFKKTFDKINTFRFLAPIGKYINGNFNSTLKMSGDLTNDLMPDFKTLNAQGLVETFNGLINGFKPLDMISKYFEEDDVKRMQLTDTKSHFSVEDGVVHIQEFDQKVADVNMKISGSHTLDQEINYLIKTKVPKEKLAKTGITDLVDKGLSNINTQLNKLGFNINEGKYINLNFIITGTVTNPKIDVRVVGVDGESDITDVVKNEVNNAIETVKDSVNTRINAEVDTLTRKVEEKRDALVDTASAIVTQKIDSVKANVQTEVSKVLKEQLGDVLPDSLVQGKIDSILNKTGGPNAEKVKDILKDWNPFKKKKKKTGLPSGG